MLRVEPVRSLDAPELAPYRTMRRQLEHRQQRIFVAEGDKVVQRLLESPLPVVSLLLPPEWLEKFKPLLERRIQSEDIVAYTAEKNVLEELTGFSMYQGVLGIGRIPELPTVAEVLGRNARPRLFVAVDSLTSAENLGVVVRNCAAFEVQALLAGETSSSPYLRRAVRSSMGAVFKLPVVELASLAEALRALRAAGVRSIAAHPHTKQKSLYQTDLTGDCCIVFGSEGYGISPAVLEACDTVAAIPMASEIDSLNVGSAAAAFLYEAARQRAKAERRDGQGRM
jgi:tRNA G18 (ribose-2'-O)-methylase SpoU